MELYILDDLLRRNEVVDEFESLVWAERFSEFGDFELLVPSTPKNRALFKPKLKLGMSESETGMVVKRVFETNDENGEMMLRIKGPSFESILNDRITAVRAPIQPAPPYAYFDLDLPPAEAIREIIARTMPVLRKPTDPNSWTSVSGYDSIPLLQPLSSRYLTSQNIPEPKDKVKFRITPRPLFEVIKEIADSWNLGFRLVKPHVGGALYFEILTGSNLTSSQKNRPAVIFSQDLGNLKNSSYLHSIEETKNIAYVSSPAGFLAVRPENVPPDADGFDRSVLWVDANDVEQGTENWRDILTQRGMEALAGFKEVRAVDGEVDQNQAYRYGTDYNLGDVVELRTVDGEVSQMRVTEQIFVSDAQGTRSYPTLTLATYVTPGSWLSWKSNVTWQDLNNDPMTWSEQS